MSDYMNLEITLEGQLRRIREDKQMLDSNKKDILRYFEFSEARGVKVSTRISVAQKLRILGQNLDKPFMEATEDDYAKLINKVAKIKKYSESTFEKFKKTIKQLLRFLNKGKLPDNVSWIPTRNPRNKIQPNHLPTEKEVELMIRSADTLMLKAMIATLDEIGPREGELANIKLKDININENRIKMYVDGKTGRRAIWIIKNYNILKSWIESHPNMKADSYLFSFSLDRSMKKPICGQNLNRKLKDIAKRVGIKKRIYCHLFRHAAATRLYKANPAYAEYALGHIQGSRMQRIYTHLDDEPVENFLLDLYGVKSNKEVENHQCNRCQTTLGLTERICPNCGMLKDGLTAYEWEKEELTITEKNIDKIAELFVPRINDILAKNRDEFKMK